PMMRSGRVAAEHEAERPARRKQRHGHVRLEAERLDEVRRYQPACARVLDEDRLRLLRREAPDPKIARGCALDALAQDLFEVAVRADRDHVPDALLFVLE